MIELVGISKVVQKTETNDVILMNEVFFNNTYLLLLSMLLSFL